VAKSLGISIDTLRDRDDQAIKKLITQFPQYRLVKRHHRPDTSSDLLFNGFFRKTSAKLQAPAFYLYPELSARAQETPPTVTERDWLKNYMGWQLWSMLVREREPPQRKKDFGDPDGDLLAMYSATIPRFLECES
jgi:hypothetical protein